MVKYYLEVGYEEHMLYANEIADKFSPGNLTSSKVTSLLKRYAKKNGITIQPLYYHTRYGLKRVYPECLYKPAMEEYLDTVQIGG